jgi:ADP-ribose pyrophosphatase YjhB (NUDIX family)
MWGQAATLVWRWLPRWIRGALTWWINAHFIVGAAAVVRDREGRVLVARHTYRRRTPWALPGGWVQRREDPETAIVREIREETGLEVEVDEPLIVLRETPWHLTIVYAARLTGGTFRPSAEVSEVRFVRPGEWPEGMRKVHETVVSDHMK